METLCFCDVGGEGESENDTGCNLMILLLNTEGDFQHLGDCKFLVLSVLV